MSKVLRFALFSVALADSECSLENGECPTSIGSHSLLAKSHDAGMSQSVLDDLKDKSLLEKSDALLTLVKGQGTPMMQKWAKEQLDMIEGMMKPAIVEHHEETGQTIQERVNRLRSALMMASMSLKKCETATQKWKTCTTELDDCKREHNDCKDVETVKKGTKETKCEILPGVQFYTSKDSVHHDTFPVLTCDFSIAGACTKNYDEWTDAITSWANTNIKTDVEDGQAAWNAAKKECDHHTTVHVSQVEECTVKKNDCADKQLKCSELETEHTICPCILGEKLKEKCEAKAAYDDIIAKVKGAGNVYSNSDREAEWGNTIVNECNWRATSQGKPFGMAEIQACISTIDFAEQVGSLNMMESEVEQMIKVRPFPFGCDDYPKCE